MVYVCGVLVTLVDLKCRNKTHVRMPSPISQWKSGGNECIIII